MSRSTDIATLLRKAANASTLSEQREFVRQAEELKSEQHTAAYGSGDWSAEDARINDTLVPGFVHEMHTAATDWITELDTSVDTKAASQSMVAEASLWYGRVSDDVKSYGDEYTEQAKNIAHKLAGQYGDYADAAEKVFTDEASRLRTTALRAGIVVEAGDAGNPDDDLKGPKQKAYDKIVEKEIDNHKDGNVKNRDFRADKAHTSSYEDDAADEAENEDVPEEFQTQAALRYEASANDLFTVLAAADGQEVTGNPGVYNDNPALTNSNRAPTFQELQSNSQDVVPVNDPGLGQTDNLTGENASRTGEEDHASKGSYPVHGNQKESSMAQKFAACPTCSGHGKVAVRERQLPSILDISKEAASGLDQIDQTVDPHDNGPKPTPYPADVAFPWVMNPQAQVPAAINQAEEQIAQRNSLSPLVQNRSQQGAPRQSVQSSRGRTAGGRDNSGWIGDNGARGLDYPGEQIGQSPVPDSAEGYVDPAHGHGGETGQNGGVKPYGAAEADDYTNNPGMGWQPGMPTQMDNGWRETVAENPALQAAAAFVEQHRQAYLRSGR